MQDPAKCVLILTIKAEILGNVLKVYFAYDFLIKGGFVFFASLPPPPHNLNRPKPMRKVWFELWFLLRKKKSPPPSNFLLFMWGVCGQPKQFRQLIDGMDTIFVSRSMFESTKIPHLADRVCNKYFDYVWVMFFLFFFFFFSFHASQQFENSDSFYVNLS